MRTRRWSSAGGSPGSPGGSIMSMYGSVAAIEATSPIEAKPSLERMRCSDSESTPPSSALISGSRSCCQSSSCATPCSRASTICSLGKSAIAVTRQSSRGGPRSSIAADVFMRLSIGGPRREVMVSPIGSSRSTAAIVAPCCSVGMPRKTLDLRRAVPPRPTLLPGRSVADTINSNVSRFGGESTSRTSSVLRAGTRPSGFSHVISSSTVAASSSSGPEREAMSKESV